MQNAGDGRRCPVSLSHSLDLSIRPRVNNVLGLDLFITCSTDKLEGFTGIITIELSRLALYSLAAGAPGIGVGIGWVIGIGEKAESSPLQKVLTHKSFPVIAVPRTINRSVCCLT